MSGTIIRTASAFGVTGRRRQRGTKWDGEPVFAKGAAGFGGSNVAFADSGGDVAGDIDDAVRVAGVLTWLRACMRALADRRQCVRGKWIGVNRPRCWWGTRVPDCPEDVQSADARIRIPMAGGWSR